MKKILMTSMIFMSVINFAGCSCKKDECICDECSNEEAALPKPQIANTSLGEQFGIDANINVETIDNYLFRKDVVYRDMRMLEDPATYEGIGGDRFLSGFVKGFEVVPFPYLSNVVVPPQITNIYDGPRLFNKVGDNYVANYEESMDILEYLFPKDKSIFLMCGGGGYAGDTRKMLISLGWDANKLYNVGGYWSYYGNQDVKVKRVEDGETYYDFYKVSYHDIDFSVLTPVE